MKISFSVQPLVRHEETLSTNGAKQLSDGPGNKWHRAIYL